MATSGNESPTRALWRKSSYSSPTSNDCVEIAVNLPSIVSIRDSKDPDGPKLTFTCQDWTAFLRRVKTGQ